MDIKEQVKLREEEYRRERRPYLDAISKANEAIEELKK